MNPRRIIQASGIASVAWVGINAARLVQNSSGPAPEPTHLLFGLIAGPLVFLLVGNVLAWLVNRAGTGERAAPGPLLPQQPALAHRVRHARRS
jgi:hypothetical protein